MKKDLFINGLMAWYALHKRPLPWRAHLDPYKIWLSEIILQQTRVVQGLPYYERFISAYPTVYDLAQASLEEVLHLWQGLGYYRRAHNLHACSKHVVSHLDGRFPTTYKELLKLPGIGPYTAAAIASIAFNEAVAVVDGNVYRVLARLFGIEEDIASTQGKKAFQELASALLPDQHAGSYNQALMEFGALHCTPQQPKCRVCPFQKECIAYGEGSQKRLPIKKRLVKVKQRYLHYLLIHEEGHLYVRQRRGQDIWQGLYDFYLIEQEEGLTKLDHLKDGLIPYIKHHGLKVHASHSVIEHQLTHQRLHICFFHLYATPLFLAAVTPFLEAKAMERCAYNALSTLPFPRAMHRFFTQERALLSRLSSEESSLKLS